VHALLARQLKRLGLSTAPPNEAEWEAFLDHVSRAYEGADQERCTLERANSAAESAAGRNRNSSPT